MEKVLAIFFTLRILTLAFAENSDNDELDFLLHDFTNNNTDRSLQDMYFYPSANVAGSSQSGIFAYDSMIQEPYYPNTGPQAALNIEQHGHTSAPEAARVHWRHEDPEGREAAKDARIQQKYKDSATGEQRKNENFVTIMGLLQQTNAQARVKPPHVQQKYAEQAARDAIKQANTATREQLIIKHAEARKVREQKRIENQKAKAAREQRKIEKEEARAAREQLRIHEEARAAHEQLRLQEEARAAREQLRIQEEARAAREQLRIQEEAREAEIQAGTPRRRRRHGHPGAQSGPY